MPEGHTTHRLARQHRRWFAGRRVAVSSPQGRFTSAAALDGCVLEDTDAYGKHLFHLYEGARVVHVHLGLFGRFTRHAVPPPEPRDTVRMRLVGADVATDLAGPNVCELITPGERDDIVARLGQDPIRDDADRDLAWKALRRRTVGIGRALMDQKVLAGVGNVFRAEVLHVHRIHPERPSRDLTRDEFDAIWATLVTWMKAGARSGRIRTVEAPEDDGQRATWVYRRDTCRRCGASVRRWDLAGRWAYACETCQPH